MGEVVNKTFGAADKQQGCYELGDFLELDCGPPEKVLKPWLPVRGIAMIAGLTGLGKTYLGLSIAHAIASGGEVLGWKADKPRKVLYVDGEMALWDLKDRLAAIHAAAEKDGNGDAKAALRNLIMFCDQAMEDGIPDLAGDDDKGRRLIEKVLERKGAEVLMLDNISALFRYSGASANEEESWIGTQDWLRSLRRKGYTVLLFHHTGKPNQQTGATRQRGTSKKEDVLNTSILLAPSPEADFTVNFTKHRSFVPPSGEFLVDIVHEGDECRLLLGGRKAAVSRLRQEHPDWSQTKIGQTIGISQSSVSRIESRSREAA